MPSQNADSNCHYPKGWMIKAFRNFRFPHKDYTEVTKWFQERFLEKKTKATAGGAE